MNGQEIPVSPTAFGEIQRWPLTALRAYERNARTHSDSQVRRLAASLREFGWGTPLLVEADGTLVYGHGRVAAARLLGWKDAPVLEVRGWSPEQIKAYRLADNRLALDAGWDDDLLRAELQDLKAADFDMEQTGFTEFEVTGLLDPPAHGGKKAEPPPPDLETFAVSRLGDVWRLGDHRLACGDCRDPAILDRLMAGDLARMIHADPPYGMGKEADGIANDNLRGDKLDAFQQQWWEACRAKLIPAGSAYIWGAAEDLWRWFHRAGGLNASEPMTAVNEIVWDKKTTPGMRSEARQMYSNVTERCLFVMLGRHILQVNRTQDDYWEGWEPIRTWLMAEREKAGFLSKDVRKICGNYMHGHWFSRSQWCLITRENYEKLATAAAGKAFIRPYEELETQFRQLQADFRGDVLGPRAAEYRAARPYFDNTWEVMTDVWDYPRVNGEERFGHATPKPAAMAERAIRSSSQDDEIVLEPFAGTGSTLIGAERCGRRCYTLEIEPNYVDLIVRRWQSMTGKPALLEEPGSTLDGLEFAVVKDARTQA